MSDAPHRIWLQAGTGEPMAGRDDWQYLKPSVTFPYILATPAALAASPEVAKLIRAAEARGLERAIVAVNKARETVIHSANRNFIDGVAFGHDRSENAIRAEAAALKGETT